MSKLRKPPGSSDDSPDEQGNCSPKGKPTLLPVGQETPIVEAPGYTGPDRRKQFPSPEARMIHDITHFIRFSLFVMVDHCKKSGRGYHTSNYANPLDFRERRADKKGSLQIALNEVDMQNLSPLEPPAKKLELSEVWRFHNCPQKMVTD